MYLQYVQFFSVGRQKCTLFRRIKWKITCTYLHNSMLLIYWLWLYMFLLLFLRSHGNFHFLHQKLSWITFACKSFVSLQLWDLNNFLFSSENWKCRLFCALRLWVLCAWNYMSKLTWSGSWILDGTKGCNKLVFALGDLIFKPINIEGLIRCQDMIFTGKRLIQTKGKNNAR